MLREKNNIFENNSLKLSVKRFSELTSEELYAILRSRAEVFAVEQGIVYQDLDGLDRYSTHVFASEGDRVVAYLRIIDAGVKFPAASIGRVLTVKEFRRRGLAREIMTLAINIALEHSSEIEIEAQAYLKEFYNSLGFIPTSDVFILEDIPHISMILQHRE